MAVPSRTALIVIDFQKAFDAMGPRNNPACEGNIAALLSSWRAAGWPVIHVRHHSRSPHSKFHASKPTSAVKDEAREAAGEPVVVKDVSSALIGTNLADLLAATKPPALLFCGIQTNYCVATTARMAGNLDWPTFVAGDACATVDQKLLDGRVVPAQMAHDLALAELNDEFAKVVSTRDALAAAKA